MGLLDNLLKNSDVSRVLAIAVATEAKRSGEPVMAKELARAFSQLVRRLDRRAFSDEVRKLERLGPDRYLETSGRILTDAGTRRR